MIARFWQSLAPLPSRRGKIPESACPDTKKGGPGGPKTPESAPGGVSRERGSLRRRVDAA